MYFRLSQEWSFYNLPLPTTIYQNDNKQIQATMQMALTAYHIATYTLLLDTDNIFEEFVITEDLPLLQDLYDMPESLFMFRPFVLQ